MSHNDTVRSEFARQASTFATSPTLAAAEVTARIGDALGDVDRVLDIACGPGLLLPTLLERAPSVVGIDLTPENLALARRASNSAQLVRGLAEQLPFAPDSFDAIVLRLALHHFVDPGTVLEAARSLLRHGGRIVVLDVLGPEDAEKQALRDALERLRDPSHTALLSRSEMVRQLERANLQVRAPTLWSQQRDFAEWARIINEPRRMADLEIVLRALCRDGRDASGLKLREEGSALHFSYDWGLFVAESTQR